MLLTPGEGRRPSCTMWCITEKNPYFHLSLCNTHTHTQCTLIYHPRSNGVFMDYSALLCAHAACTIIHFIFYIFTSFTQRGFFFSSLQIWSWCRTRSAVRCFTFLTTSHFSCNQRFQTGAWSRVWGPSALLFLGQNMLLFKILVFSSWHSWEWLHCDCVQDMLDALDPLETDKQSVVYVCVSQPLGRDPFTVGV